MHLAKTLTLFALTSGALSFKIRAFTGEDCSGDAKEVNVWDNTCRDSNVPKTKSFRVLAYGGHAQRAVFWKHSHCGDFDKDFKSWWSDGGSDEFKKDACLNLGYESNAYGSQISV
ncbi:hypothetical protein ASPWEDRAFT_178685 [Aspergillus wentii DTO 134E9]|uniref:Cyanovirin-N domain-containing protein n=1 Tax=Aspergillus wentii DTO 134E9 TaxID=1073089 RepID=A0A1L9S135_ASPWE|nr:uncharacterized protein ASPWEDRAFT_178685 [Aspergillus wentii DTO 134E9]KAI9931126.1 hypothetical protein MW887_010783 [Aspergillus wentii]OJJ40871.1 hypothetical protein ASPWEDRAFT_178685 [Aspergillus wentii DTO 134E9]